MNRLETHLFAGKKIHQDMRQFMVQFRNSERAVSAKKRKAEEPPYCLSVYQEAWTRDPWRGPKKALRRLYKRAKIFWLGLSVGAHYGTKEKDYFLGRPR